MESITTRLPLVSIIIVNWNGGLVFRKCLDSLSKINYLNWELIIVDNGSIDSSDNYINSFKKIKKYKIINNKKNIGFAPANNQGYKYAKGKYLLLLNNDTKVTKDFLTELVARIEQDKTIAVIQPKIFLMDTDHQLDNAGSFLTKIGFLYHWGFMEKDGPEFNHERFIFSAKGACMLIRKKVVDKIGLFDEDFVSYFEESDFCWRVWLAGYKVLFYPKAVIYHKLGFTIRRLDVVGLNYHYYKNRIRSLIKNLERKNLFLILLPHVMISVGLIIIFLLRSKIRNAMMILKALSWNLQNLTKTIRLKKVIQSKRKVSDNILFQKLSKNIDWFKYWHDFKRVEEDSLRKV